MENKNNPIKRVYFSSRDGIDLNMGEKLVKGEEGSGCDCGAHHTLNLSYHLPYCRLKIKNSLKLSKRFLKQNN